MECFVTGASGFIGSNLVHELTARGHRVRALVRPGSNPVALEGAQYERVEGDLHDSSGLRRLIAGCDWCFHLAASYHLWLADYRPMYAANVEGTRHILTAAAAAGCTRIVHTSTVGCLRLLASRNGQAVPADETCVAAENEMADHYKRSKWRAEQIANELASQGAPVVIVSPSAPVGPRDHKPTPTGQIVLDFLKRRLPAYCDTGLNWVHVRDVAVGHILAAERGRVGERYILGNSAGNWTLRETLAVLARITGLPAPAWRMPHSLALAAGFCSHALSAVTGRPPRVPLTGVRMARHRMFFDPSKAIRELGLPQTSPEQALRDAVEWFRANRYVTT